MIQQFRSVVTLLGRFACRSSVLAGWLTVSCLFLVGGGSLFISGQRVLGQEAAAKSPAGPQSGEKPTDQLKWRRIRRALDCCFRPPR